MALLEMKHIYKNFGKVQANSDVNLTVEKGEVHALLGENGAGKSTLMNILYGIYPPTEGKIYLKGEKVKIHSPKDAIEKGIGMVHQHFMLIPALTVIENVVLGLKDNKVVLDLKTAAQRFTELASRFDMKIDPFEKIENLTVGQQQRVEILKTLYRDADILILDEPTAVLTPQEVKKLFGVIRQLTEEGLTIIFISHKLNEIMEICDQCTILRAGQVVKTVPISQVSDRQELAQLMVGREVEMTTAKAAPQLGDTVMEVENLTFVDKQKVKRLDDVSFTLRKGEILSICGVDGNGQSELVKCLTGLEHATAGKVSINGVDCTKAKPRDVLAHKVGHIPEDRHKMGMIGDMTITENMVLMNYSAPECSKHGFMKWKEIKRHVQQLCEKYQVKTPSVDEKMGNLSGGNQQKVVVGRELEKHPDLLIAMHPDRGLDIGATKYIQKEIVGARDSGAGVLLISTELEEIMELSDRILVIFQGKVMGIVDQKDATMEGLGLMMAGVKDGGQEEHDAE